MPENARYEPFLADDVKVYRRIQPDWIKPGEVPRPGSYAFQDNRSGEVSVFIAELITPEELLANYPSFSLVVIEAGYIRGLGYPVRRDDPEGDPAHAFFLSPKGSDARKMAKTCEWVIRHD
jgi:hypothetical protein